MSLADTVTSTLGPDGIFARTVPGFVPRSVQMDFAASVAAAVEASEALIAEAGTGTGKTFGYLVPILLGGRRAVIATATRALQDQLFEHDLPLAARALGRPVRVAVLKGRTNYLCRERLRHLESDLVGTTDLDLPTVRVWARATRTGDLAELPAAGESGAARRLLTVAADACAGSACPEYARCHVFAARRRAQEADVVIVNHHLLIADYALRSEGGHLLGETQVVVVDEAHALTEVARTSLGRTLTSFQLAELAEDSEPFLRTAMGSGAARSAVRALTEAARVPRGIAPGGRYAWSAIAGSLHPLVTAARDATATLAQALAGPAEAAPVAARAASLAAALEQWNASTQDERDFRWVEIRPGGAYSLHANPLEPGETIAQWVGEGSASWIFSSATLAIAGSFEPITRDLGLSAPRTFAGESPFDFSAQARLYVPRGLPDVDDPGYTAAVVDAADPLIRAAGGGCFLLFTSRQALARAAELLRERGLVYPLFVQDEAPRARLLEEFRAAGNGVLLGTASFWEGVDVKGDALVLVVIDRLPFASPGDPLLRARLERCRDAGGNPFADIQLPEAAMALKQGAGRLIRDADDRGVLMVCDPRLRSRSYGRVFLRSLPPMPLIDEVDEAIAFLAACTPRSTACA